MLYLWKIIFYLLLFIVTVIVLLSEKSWITTVYLIALIAFFLIRRYIMNKRDIQRSYGRKFPIADRQRKISTAISTEFAKLDWLGDLLAFDCAMEEIDEQIRREEDEGWPEDQR